MGKCVFIINDNYFTTLPNFCRFLSIFWSVMYFKFYGTFDGCCKTSYWAAKKRRMQEVTILKGYMFFHFFKNYDIMLLWLYLPTFTWPKCLLIPKMSFLPSYKWPKIFFDHKNYTFKLQRNVNK